MKYSAFGVAIVCIGVGLAASATAATSPPVAWASAPKNNWTSATQVIVNGKAYWPESAEMPYSIQIAQNAASDLTRFEVRNNELWTGAMGGNDTERAELDGGAGATYPIGTEFWLAYQFMVEPGAPQIATAGGFPGGPAAWCVLGQIHGNKAEQPVPWQLNLIKDKLSVSTQKDPGQTWVTHWTASAPISRGRVYSVVVRLKISGLPTDMSQVWIDGEKVVDYVGVIGSARPDPAVYFKFGIYRGWQGDGYPPLAVQFSNVMQGTASLASYVTSPRAWPAAKSE